MKIMKIGGLFKGEKGCRELEVRLFDNTVSQLLCIHLELRDEFEKPRLDKGRPNGRRDGRREREGGEANQPWPQPNHNFSRETNIKLGAC